MKILISLYLKDLLRNKMLGIMVILVPIIFYPLMYWGITQFLMVKSGFEESRKVNLYYRIDDPGFSSLKDSIASISGFVPLESNEPETENNGISLIITRLNDLPRYEVFLDSSNAVQKSFYGGLEKKLIAYYKTELEKLMDDKNYQKEYFKVYNIESVNIEGQDEIVTKILSFIIPLMAVISIISSVAAASVELGSGHSEDKTTETTLTIPADRKDVILSKFFTVVIYGMLAGLVNFILLVTMIIVIFKNMIGQIEAGLADFDWGLIMNFRNISISFVSLVLIAFFVSLIFVTAAGFASKRKDGNIMVSPFTAVITYLPLVIVIPAIEPNILIAMTPVLNIAFALKLIISNDLNMIFIAEAVAFSFIWVIVLYRFLFPFLLEEEVLLGYSNTSLIRKIKLKMGKWKKK